MIGSPLPSGTELPASARIRELDALRGLAVAGIVLMNVFAFAMHSAAYYNPRAWGGEGPLDLALWASSFVLVEDKFRTLFAMMFGVGVLILLGRPDRHRLRGHYARMAVLFALGWLHATVLYSGDVLRLYAFAGLVLPLAVGWSVRRLWLGAAVLMALHLAIGGYVAFGWLEYWWRWANETGVDPRPMLPAEYAFGADPEAIRIGLERGGEGFGERIARRLADPFGPLLAALMFLPSTLAAMLAGMALWRGGLLAGAWPARRAVPLGRTLAVIAFNGVVVGANALLFSAPFDLALGIAWAALAMALFGRAGAGSAWLGRLAATGRLALTNYLATSVVLSAMYASWGLGLFGQTGRVATYGAALVPIALMLVWSPWWLARFRQGPAEWLWRSLAQGDALPLRR
ncbi:MAG: hypothetical protein B7Z08_11020 [Sphingomonadales bacterium 32-68-7]|nr:MAG: hypothetical protein B7Z08_11020 [Sphingomonadales bacterium 32-68-7]